MNDQKTYTLPDLKYDFNALEPVISAEIMQLHYQKHHGAYVTNLNAALEKYAVAESKQQISEMIALQNVIKFNGGGHINHSIFWSILGSPSTLSQDRPSGKLLEMIVRDFGSFEIFKERLSGLSVGIQGSGWGWLGYHLQTKKLELAAMSNQDPLATLGMIPLVGIDVWEHAYYLQYKNMRAEYVKQIWQVLDWKAIENRYSSAIG